MLTGAVLLCALVACSEDPDAAPSDRPTATPSSLARGTCVEARTGPYRMHLSLPEGFAAIEDDGDLVRMKRSEGANEVSVATLAPYRWARTQDSPDQELLLRTISNLGDGRLSNGPEFEQAAATLTRTKADEVEYRTPNPADRDQQVAVYATVRHQDEQRFVLALFAPPGATFTEVKTKALATLATGTCPKN